jgi:hypothetical protein
MWQRSNGEQRGGLPYNNLLLRQAYEEKKDNHKTEAAEKNGRKELT